MKQLKKILAIVLCIVITLTAAPLNSFVGSETTSSFSMNAKASATYEDTYWAMSEREALAFIGFIYDKRKVTDEMKETGDLYDFLTGKLERDSVEEIAAKISFLFTARQNLQRCLVSYRKTMQNVEEYVLEYFMDKLSLGSVTADTAEDILSLIISNSETIFKKLYGLDDKTKNALIDIGSSFEKAQNLLDKFELFFDALNLFTYTSTTSKFKMYTYVSSYIGMRDYKNTNPEYFEEIMSATRIGMVGALEDPILSWYSKDHIAVLERFGDFIFFVDKSFEKYNKPNTSNPENNEYKNIKGLEIENVYDIDLYIQDNNGNNLVSIINSEVKYLTNDIIVSASATVFEKKIVLPSTRDYKIIMQVPTDNLEGTFIDYRIKEISDNAILRTVEYENLKLNSGHKYTLNIPKEIYTKADNYNLISDTEEVFSYSKDSVPEIATQPTDVIVSEELFDNFSVELIENVADTMFNFESVVDVANYNISTEDAGVLFSAVSKYYPVEYSLLTNSDFTYKIIFSPSRNCITDIRFYYGDDANKSVYQKRVDDLNAEIDKVVSQVEGMNDFEKALYIHDYIVLNSEYDLELLEILETEGTLDGELRSERYTEYSILVNGTGVCGSYALAYRALMNAAGVDCLYLSSRQMDHAWNLVKIDGEWYHVDCCWDDPTPDTYGRARRTYFLRTDAEIMKLNHYSWSPGKYKATSTKYSEMPRNYDLYQKYNSNYWYVATESGVEKIDLTGSNAVTVLDFAVDSIAYVDGVLYYLKNNKVYGYDPISEKTWINYVSPNNKTLSNIYIADNALILYGYEYNNNKKAYFKLSVSDQKELYEELYKVELSEKNLDLQVFDEVKLSVTMHSYKATDGLVCQWESSNNMVAFVKDDGTVVARDKGEAVITVSVGDFKDSCMVTVETDERRGFCSNNTKWTYNPEKKELIISPYESYTEVGSIVINGKEKEIVEKVIFEDGITHIGDNAFEGWAAIKFVNFNEDLKQIGKEVFKECISIEEVVIPDSVTTVSSYAFQNCTNIVKVTTGASISHIGGGIFENCSSLETVNYNTVRINPFWLASGPGYTMFDHCDKLSNFNIGSNVERFSCRLLEPLDWRFNNIDEIVFPASVKRIEHIEKISYRADSLVSIEVDESNPYYESIDGVLFDKETYDLLWYPAGKTTTTYTIPLECKKINNSAFEKAIYLEEVIITDNVVSLGSDLFTFTNPLLKVNIGKNVSEILEPDCWDVAQINVDPKNQMFSSEDGVLFNKEKTNLIRYPDKNTRDYYRVPDGTTTIADRAFELASNLKKVFIPSTLETITPDSFYTNSLTDFVVDEKNTSFSSVDGVLFNKNKTILIEYPNNNERTSYNIPDGVVEINEKAFDRASYLYVVSFPSSVNSIGRQAFWLSSNLKTAIIPESISFIGYEAFPFSLQKVLILNKDCGFGDYDNDGKDSDIGIDYWGESEVYGYSGSTAEEYAIEHNLPFIDIETQPHEHSYFLVDCANKSENSDGFKHYKCYCGNDEYIEHSHSFGKTIVEGNCESGLISVSVCNICGYKDAQSLGTAEHKYVLESTVLGNCQNPTKEIYKCSVCSHTEDIYTKADECHSYIETITEPTCTEIGYITGICEYCDESVMYDFVAPKGHSLTMSYREATCKEYASIEYACRECDYFGSYIHKDEGYADHTAPLVVTKPTCVENGSLDRICTTCNSTVSHIPIDALDHISSEWEIIKEPTTESAGKREKYCTNCGILLEEEHIPKIVVNVTGIMLNKNEITIENQQNYQLIATIHPDNADDKNVTWGSDNTDVAIVDKTGMVTALSVGSATVIATTADGDYTANCKVTVTPRNFKVTWNVDGTETSSNIAEGSKITAPHNPTKTGYTFTGWIPKIPTVMPAEDLTFSAAWDANSYLAIFNVNGGKWSNGTSADKTVTVEFDSDIPEQEAPEKQGYVFAGWEYNGNNLGTNVGKMLSIDGMMFTAVWVPASDTRYTVRTYTMAENGEYVLSETVLIGTTKETVTVLPEIQSGFELNKDNSVLSGTIAADNSLILTVYIDRKTFTFTTVVDGKNTSVNYMFGVAVTEPETPTKEGYTFDGWDSPIPQTMPADNVKLTAQWNVNTYTVTWVINGDKTVDILNYGAEIVKPKNPAKKGYTFTGWTPEVPATVPANNLTFTAQYELLVKQMKIKNPSTTTINYGETLVLHADYGNVELPEGWTIQWTVEGAGFSMAPSEDGMTCKLTSIANGNATVKATLVEENGEAVLDAEGDEMSDTKELTSKAGFWQKFVSFFKNLFGISRIILQSI